MMEGLDLLKERLEIYSNGKTKKADIIKTLQNAGVKFEDVSEAIGYPNIRVWAGGGYARIYKGPKMRSFKVQVFRKMEVKSSGIPTFEPSGRKSL